MKKKILAILTMVLLASGLINAQIRLGIRAGLNVSRLKSDKEVLTPVPSSVSNYRITVPNYAMLGYHVGLIGQVNLFNIFIQPEALYTVTRNDINIYDLNSANPTESMQTTQKLNRIDIPILAGIKFTSFKAGIGPVFTFLISDDSDLKKITEYDMQLNKATVGYQVGIGFDFKKLALDLKYEGSLSKVSDGINLGDNEKMSFDSRVNQVILSAGIFF